jgi:hypothetical protein
MPNAFEIATAGTNQMSAPEGERGFLDKVYDSFGRGQKEVMADIAVYEAMENPDREDLTGARIARKKLLNDEALHPIEGRYLTSLVYKSAHMAGQLVTGLEGLTLGGAVGAVGGGVIGAVAAGPAGAAAGAAAGSRLGGLSGSTIMMYRQGAGAMYDAMLDQGIDPETAKTAAKIGALPYALASTFVPVKTLGAPFVKAVSGRVAPLLSDTASKAIARGLGTYLKGITGVVGGAEIQAMTEIATEKAAQSYQEGGINIDNEFLSSTGKTLLSVLKSAPESGALLPIPGAVLEGLVAHASTRMGNEISKALDRTDDVGSLSPRDISDPQMKIARAIIQGTKSAIIDVTGTDEAAFDRAEKAAYVKHTTTAQGRGEPPMSYDDFVFQRRSNRLWREQEKKRSVERSERLGKEIGEVRAQPDAADYTHQVEKTLKGREYDKLGIQPLSESVPIEALHSVVEEIVHGSSLQHMEAYNLVKAIETLYTDGGQLRPYELKLARKAGMNPNLIRAMEALNNLGKTERLSAIKSVNDTMRSLSSAGDLSLTLRQEKFTATSPRKLASLLALQGKILTMSEKGFQQWHKDFLNTPEAQAAQKYGVVVQEVGGGYDTGSEFFSSKHIQNLPGIASTERAFIGGGNYARIQRFVDVYKSKAGAASEKDLRDLAKIINITGGIGDVKALGRYAPYLNSVFFAPRNFFGNVESFTELFDPKLSGLARKYLAWNWVKFVSVNAGVLGALSQVPGVDIETDHRSTDFGKIKIGNTHIDFWAGYLPLARTVMRLIERQRKTAGGDIVDADAKDTITRFLQQKLGPVPSTLLDFWKGETAVGEKRDWTDPAEFTREVYDKFTPFFIQDLVDAVKSEGLSVQTGLAGLSSFFGASTSTYPVSKSTEVALKRNSVALEVFHSKWDQLGPEGQKYLRAKFPEIAQGERAAQFERDHGYFMNTVEKNLVRSQKHVYQSMPKDVRDELDNMNVVLSGVNKRVGTNWYLNDSRYKEYETDVIKDYQSVLPRLMRSPAWAKMNPAGKAEMLKKVCEQLKEGERKRIIYKANLEDLKRIQYGGDGSGL